MKINITASSSSLEAQFDPRFGRCAFFIFVDTDTLQWEAFPNPGINTPGGAGTQAAQFVAEKNVTAVISGDFGPNAASVLKAAGISMFINKSDGTVQDIINRFNAGELQQVNSPTASGTHHS